MDILLITDLCVGTKDKVKTQIMQAVGVIIRESPYSVKESMNRLQNFLIQQGVTIYKRIDQQSEVNDTGQCLLPLEFIMFGNPKAGGVLMKENPLIALDLPLKAIAWEDTSQKVWLAYNAGTYIEERYSLKQKAGSPLNLDNMMESLFGCRDC